ncbi:MAG: triphosphoribosyl-dephospho-CoA synthase [Candidatus Bathyarchaeota archaeon]|nr:triphosphoribosyl-dephospho-CoA synthase [Candidatus Bathyarchaeota archaeon]
MRLASLSKVPDTHICHKAGLRKGKEVSEKAGKTLDLGGLFTLEARESLPTSTRNCGIQLINSIQAQLLTS